jgi:hypothetical protein
MHPEPHKIVRVLFDESHSESWTVSAERAREMQPENPANSSYQRAAALLSARDFSIHRNLHRSLERDTLAEADVLALLHPCDPRWERTTTPHSATLSPQEIEDILAFVRAGGGLLVVTEYEHAKYGDNLNDLLAPAGLRIETGTAIDRTACLNDNIEWLFAEPGESTVLTHGVTHACFYRAGWVRALSGETKIAWKTSPRAYPADAGLIATAQLGKGRIVVMTDSVLFGDERIGAYEHEQLWLNIVHWLSAPAFRQRGAFLAAESAPSAPWHDLKGAINQLRTRQLPDGSVPAEHHAEAGSLVGQTLAACTALGPQFPHQSDYLAQLAQDFHDWVGGGYKRPDFGRSLAVFHPERDRRDGREHLVLFPLYTPNASSDTRCEALIMRTPWPDWLARLERSNYHNTRFAPGHLVDFTDGYASECAVLFPETIALAAHPSNHFATIFCDREARRLQSCTLRAASAVHLELFPELECWLGSPALIADTTALWDLIHDASHSLGELPFDPFMIRQRAPFWMYAIEELRVDLRSFEEAARLAADGFPFARYVTWAIVLDRIFRFPITGRRVRNYDALGGQILFACLHQRDAILWRDNRLTIRWDAVAAGIHGLREELAALYKFGADCSKLTFWLNAHALVAKYVPPNVASHWRDGAREINDERDLRKWIALVHEDEFPLGNFHLNLQRKLEGLRPAGP